MSQYYRAQRVRNLYDPASPAPYRLSRSKIDLFLNCPRCFYLDRRLGISQPPGYPFSLNSAVDALLKKEFDLHRAAGTPHPLMKTYGIDAIPLAHELIEAWRNSLSGGITYQVPGTNLLITGGVDDIWVNPSGELIIVDYKATSKKDEVSLDADWQIGYKRQMEIYQWLFRMNGYTVSDTGYFVYCNGDSDREAFDGRLEFAIKLIPYTGDTSWIQGTIEELYQTLASNDIPQMGPECDFCLYTSALKTLENN
jgi:hypothetical protein